LRVEGLGFRGWGLGFRVGFNKIVTPEGFRVEGSKFNRIVSPEGFRV
jgi:hypothetical protein